MDTSLFSDKSPGKLRKITIPDGSDWSFIPDSLPVHWEIPGSLWPLVVEAHKELARLDGIGRHMPNYELLLRPLQNREALKSSSLEGTYATPEQLFLFEIEPKEAKFANGQMNARKEVYNYGRALRHGQELINEIPVSLRLIKELHKELLRDVRGQERDPGNFRNKQVYIGSDRRFIPPPPPEAMECLYALEKDIHRGNDIEKMIFCFMIHYQFEGIHPFLDGNGRVGRLLLSLMIYKWCDLVSPWLYLSPFFDAHKDEYIDLLFNVSAKGDWSGWISFCLRATIHQAKDAIRRFDKLVSLKDQYRNAVLACGGSIRMHRIIDRLLESPAITIPLVGKMFDISYPTAKTDIDTLIKCNILYPAGEVGRPKVFISPEIIETVYGD
jgi:Fic family protein